jgi:hypothetical protein
VVTVMEGEADVSASAFDVRLLPANARDFFGLDGISMVIVLAALKA